MKTLVYFALLAFPFAGVAQERDLEQSSEKPFHVRFIIGSGSGGDIIHSGIITTEGQHVTISAGGDLSIGFSAGYTFKDRLNFSIGYRNEFSSLEPMLDNANGAFSRNIGSLRAAIDFPIYRRLHGDVGLGLLYIAPSELDLDASEIVGGAHNIYSYPAQFVPEFFLEFEWYTKKKRWSWVFGLDYHPATYKLEEFTSNGFAVDPIFFSDSFFSETRRMEGNTLNVNFGMCFHF